MKLGYYIEWAIVIAVNVAISVAITFFTRPPIWVVSIVGLLVGATGGVLWLVVTHPEKRYAKAH